MACCVRGAHTGEGTQVGTGAGHYSKAQETHRSFGRAFPFRLCRRLFPTAFFCGRAEVVLLAAFRLGVTHLPPGWQLRDAGRACVRARAAAGGRGGGVNTGTDRRRGRACRQHAKVGRRLGSAAPPRAPANEAPHRWPTAGSPRYSHHCRAWRWVRRRWGGSTQANFGQRAWTDPYLSTLFRIPCF